MRKSHAGTNTWEGAQFENGHLATIVPSSGSIGVEQMLHRDGSNEDRAFVYDALHTGSTRDSDADELQVCTDDLIGSADPWTTYTAVELGGDQWNDHWEERYHLPDVLANHGGRCTSSGACRAGTSIPDMPCPRTSDCWMPASTCADSMDSGTTTMRASPRSTMCRWSQATAWRRVRT